MSFPLFRREFTRCEQQWWFVQVFLFAISHRSFLVFNKDIRGIKSGDCVLMDQKGQRIFSMPCRSIKTKKKFQLSLWSGLISSHNGIWLFQVDKVQLVDRLGVEPNVVGTLHVTTSHIIFRSEEGSKELWVSALSFTLSAFIPLRYTPLSNKSDPVMPVVAPIYSWKRTIAIASWNNPSFSGARLRQLQST